MHALRTPLLTVSLLAIFAAGACTFQPQDGQLNAAFHPPLVYSQWESRRDTDDNGDKLCILTTGHNGLNVVIGNHARYVEHTRRYSAGMLTTLRVNGHTYRTPSAGFAASQTDAIIADLAVADKAYLEWSEVYVNGPSRNRTSTILKLDPVAGMLKACGVAAP